MKNLDEPSRPSQEGSLQNEQLAEKGDDFCFVGKENAWWAALPGLPNGTTFLATGEREAPKMKQIFVCATSSSQLAWRAVQTSGGPLFMAVDPFFSLYRDFA